MKIKNGNACPICKEAINVESFFKKNGIIFCPGCYAKIKIVTINPVEVQVVRSL